MASPRTSGNKSGRCEGRLYDQSESTTKCYKLQKKLIEAALKGNLTGIRAALRDGANPNGTYYNSFPPLYSAVMFGRMDATRLLLDNGADVNRVSGFENTALNAAASEGYANIVRLLLERGADVCFKSTGGTAGDIARARGFNEVAELLRSKEASKCG